MSIRQLSEISKLVDLKSSVSVAIALQPDFGQHSAQSIAAEYEGAIDDLPRSLLHEVLNGKYRDVFPPSALPLQEPAKMASLESASIPAILDRHFLSLYTLINEFCGVSVVIDDILLNLDWTKCRKTWSTADVDPIYFVGTPSLPNL